MLSFVAPDAQAQETINICNRTPQVRDWILNETPAEDECGSVLVSEMAAIPIRDDPLIDEPLDLGGQNIAALKSGDFDGLTIVEEVWLNNNNLMTLPSGIFSGMPKLARIDLRNNALVNLPPDVFSNLPPLFFELNLSNNHLSTLPNGIFRNLSDLHLLFLRNNALVNLPPDVFLGLVGLRQLFLTNNRLDALPDGIFSGLLLARLRLEDNSDAPFRFTVRFEPETLEEDFTAEPVRLVLREGAPRRITVPLLVTGSGGELMTGSPGSLTLAAGSTQSDTVTVIRGSGSFKLSQGELELSGSDANYTGFEIVRGRSITVGGIQVRARVFLEGALE